MNSLELKRYALLTIPLLLIPSTGFVFVVLSKWLGKEKGYLLGFLFYWAIWCLLIPLIFLGRNNFLFLFVDITPLFSKPNLLVAVLFGFITLITLLMYGKDLVRASLSLIPIAIPAATINGICEEALWRGLFVKTFPNNLWLAILFPAIGFALWHFVPQQIFSKGNRFTFVLSTFFLGLAYGFIAYRTGSAKWTAISHSLNAVLALGGSFVPIILKLFRSE